MSSAQFAGSISISSKKKSQMKIPEKRGSNIDPRDTSDSTLL